MAENSGRDFENSGRVLMLLLALGSTAVLYRLARRFTGSDAAPVLAALTFALSPLYYGRMVLRALAVIGTALRGRAPAAAQPAS